MSSRFTEAQKTIIENNTQTPTNISNNEEIVSVAFYGRVSKEEQNQLRSLENQKEFFGN
jgi:hypothetical protein